MQSRLTYKVEARISFTEEELDHLVRQAKAHYDTTCKAMAATAEETGLNGPLTIARILGETTFTSREVNILCKILELPGSDPALQRSLNDLHKDMQGVEAAEAGR